MRITATQYRAIKDKSRLSKDDKSRLEKGLTPTASEAIEQEKFANFLRLLSSGGKVVAFSAIPADTYTPFSSVKKRTKKIGYRKGLPDMIIVYKEKNGDQKAVFVEMKKERGGRVSPDQEKWINIINGTVGLAAYVCNGFKDAAALILRLSESDEQKDKELWNIANEETSKE